MSVACESRSSIRGEQAFRFKHILIRESAYSGGSDHALWLDPGIGVPCPLLIQWPDRFYHSSLDGPGRCDPVSRS